MRSLLRRSSIIKSATRFSIDGRHWWAVSAVIFTAYSDGIVGRIPRHEPTLSGVNVGRQKVSTVTVVSVGRQHWSPTYARITTEIKCFS